MKKTISSELLKGSLRTIVLKLLKEEGPLHGYAITQRVEEITQQRIRLSYGALYPLLHKLEKEKVLTTTAENYNNRIRICYSLTPKGHSLVGEKVKELKEFIESLNQIIDLKPGISHV